jgi:hypothetical protein
MMIGRKGSEGSAECECGEGKGVRQVPQRAEDMQALGVTGGAGRDEAGVQTAGKQQVDGGWGGREQDEHAGPPTHLITNFMLAQAYVRFLCGDTVRSRWSVAIGSPVVGCQWTTREQEVIRRQQKPSGGAEPET